VFVEGLSAAPQNHPLGEMFSYCNSGYAALGCIVEAVTGQTWDVALQERLAVPLGIDLATLPEQAILRPHALGHIEQLGADGAVELGVAPLWGPPRSVGPAGTICSTAEDVIRFGAMHARLGTAESGVAVLSTGSAAAMQQPQVRVVDPWVVGEAWGLGWILPTSGVIGHDGATFGQYAFYRLHLETATSIVLLTNGPGARGVFDALQSEYFADLAGVSVPTAPTPPHPGVTLTEPSRFVGDYERASLRIEVREAADSLELTMVPLGEYADVGGGAETVRFVGFEPDTVISAAPVPGSGVHMTARFVVAPGETRAHWLHLGGRAARRCA
jgi:CubicO group peptidase (beta-lactamase class C family)